MLRLALVVVGGLGIMAASGWYLQPRPAKKAEYKFVRCEVCQFELGYTAQLAGQRCPHCQPPTIGKLVPATKSIHEGGAENPWKPFNIAMSVEGVCLLGAVVFLLYNPPKHKDKGYLYMRCPRCGRKLRFSRLRAGAEGQCPGCKNMIGFPTLEEAESF